MAVEPSTSPAAHVTIREALPADAACTHLNGSVHDEVKQVLAL